jgi:hydroxymethylpyrimidine/phosphomethylpyrimidine kinase
MLTALIERVLPSTTVLSATLPEAKALLDTAKVPIDYPSSMQGVATMGNALLSEARHSHITRSTATCFPFSSPIISLL